MATVIRPAPPGGLLRPGEAAALLGITPSGLRRRRARGQAPSARTPGAQNRYPPDALLEASAAVRPVSARPASHEAIEEVPCGRCGAQPGFRCLSPSGYRALVPHAARRSAAAMAGTYQP